MVKSIKLKEQGKQFWIKSEETLWHYLRKQKTWTQFLITKKIKNFYIIRVFVYLSSRTWTQNTCNTETLKSALLPLVLNMIKLYKMIVSKHSNYVTYPILLLFNIPKCNSIHYQINTYYQLTEKERIFESFKSTLRIWNMMIRNDLFLVFEVWLIKAISKFL